MHSSNGAPSLSPCPNGCPREYIYLRLGRQAPVETVHEFIATGAGPNWANRARCVLLSAIDHVRNAGRDLTRCARLLTLVSGRGRGRGKEGGKEEGARGDLFGNGCGELLRRDALCVALPTGCFAFWRNVEGKERARGRKRGFNRLSCRVNTTNV